MRFSVKSYATFTAYSGFPDVFTDYCLKNGIALRNVKYSSGSVTADISTGQYYRLKKAAKAGGVRLKINKYGGLVKIIKTAEKKAGILLGLAAAAVILCYLSGGLWRIEVRGNENVFTDELINCLNQCGVYTGTRRKNVISDEVERKLSEMLDGRVHWLSLNIEGCAALLEVKEKPREDEPVYFGSPCNVVADFDGIIDTVSVKRGIGKVEPGFAVKKGDMLITGVVENSDSSNSFYEADGECTARHRRKIAADMSETEFFKPVNIKRRAEIFIFGIKTPFGSIKHPQKALEYSESADVSGIILPVKITGRIYFEEEAVKPDEDIIELLAYDTLFTEMKRKLSGTSVLDSEYSYKDGRACLNADCVDYIGVQKKIMISE